VQHELKTDAKIDMLHQSGLFASPVKQPAMMPHVAEEQEEEDEEIVERSLVRSEFYTWTDDI
jgi:kinesin family protein 20